MPAMNKIACPDCGVTVVECRRYRLEPLAEFMRLTMSQTCIEVRISGSSQKQALCHGVTRRIVDRIAAELRVHPAEIWPEVVDHDIEDAEVECADADCTQRFVPSRAGHVFCSRTCCQRRKKREHRRREYQDPVFREAFKAKVAAHYQEVKGYRTAQMRRYRARKRAGREDEAA